MNDPMDKALAKMIAAVCVRNTRLEDLHSGRYPSSRTGDYSDVTVVTPYGEIPWNEVSRLNDAEMKRLMKEVVDKLYTFLHYNRDVVFLENFMAWAGHFIQEWDDPKLDESLSAIKQDRKPKH